MMVVMMMMVGVSLLLLRLLLMVVVVMRLLLAGCRVPRRVAHCAVHLDCGGQRLLHQLLLQVVQTYLLLDRIRGHDHHVAAQVVKMRAVKLRVNVQVKVAVGDHRTRIKHLDGRSSSRRVRHRIHLYLRIKQLIERFQWIGRLAKI